MELDKLKWHTEKRVVEDLIPHPKNPRRLTDEQKARLLESLDKFNLAEIPAINLDNMILAGHQRCMLLKELGRGQEEIDVRVPNRLLTPEEADEYLLRSNRNTGEWDFDKLTLDFDNNMLFSVGFSDSELNFERDFDSLESEFEAMMEDTQDDDDVEIRTTQGTVRKLEEFLARFPGEDAGHVIAMALGVLEEEADEPVSLES